MTFSIARASGRKRKYSEKQFRWKTPSSRSGPVARRTIAPLHTPLGVRFGRAPAYFSTERWARRAVAILCTARIYWQGLKQYIDVRDRRFSRRVGGRPCRGADRRGQQ